MAKIKTFQVNNRPTAALIPEFEKNRGSPAPSVPDGHIYLQK